MTKKRSLLFVLCILSATISAARPVVFLHGYNADSSVWSNMIKLLKSDAGYSASDLHAFSYYNSSFGNSKNTPIMTVAQGVAREITDIYYDSGMQKVDLVTHSMGGLVVRAMLAYDLIDKQCLGRFITLGTPHYGQNLEGSNTADIAGKQADQMKYGSRFLWDLAEAWHFNGKTLPETLCIAGVYETENNSKWDGLVHVWSAALGNAPCRYVKKCHSPILSESTSTGTFWGALIGGLLTGGLGGIIAGGLIGGTAGKADATDVLYQCSNGTSDDVYTLVKWYLLCGYAYPQSSLSYSSPASMITSTGGLFYQITDAYGYPAEYKTSTTKLITGFWNQTEYESVTPSFRDHGANNTESQPYGIEFIYGTMPTGSYQLTGAASQTTPAFKKSNISVTGGRVTVLRIRSEVNLTFNANGGSFYSYWGTDWGTDWGTYAAGMYSTFPTPYRTGYSSYGWTNSVGNYIYSYDYAPETDMTLYASWYANRYFVTFDQGPDTGYGVYATYDSPMPYISEPSIRVPTRDGYLFGGYFSERDGKGTQYYSASGTSTHTYDLAYGTTLFAKWTKWETAADINSAGSGIKLTWDAMPSASTYTVWRSTTDLRENASKITTIASTSRSYMDSSASPGKRYWYWIEAKDSSGSSILFGSAIAAIRHLSVAGNVTAQCGASTNSILVTWSAVQGVSYYQICRENSCCSFEEGVSPVIATTTQTSYLDTDVAPGFEYSYWIVTKTADDTSASEQVNGFTRYPVPVISNMQSFNDRYGDESLHHVLVSWDTFPLNEQACVLPAYRLYRADSPDGELTLVRHIDPEEYFDLLFDYDGDDEWGPDTGGDTGWYDGWYDDEDEGEEWDDVELELEVTDTVDGKIISFTVWDNENKNPATTCRYYLEAVPEFFDPETESYDEDMEIYRMMESGLSEPASVFIHPTTAELPALLDADLRRKGYEFEAISLSGPVSAVFEDGEITAVRLNSYPGSTGSDWGNGARSEISFTTSGNGRLVWNRNVDGTAPLQLYLDGERLKDLYDTGSDWDRMTNNITDGASHVWTFRFEKDEDFEYGDSGDEDLWDEEDPIDSDDPHNCALLRVASWQPIPAVTFSAGEHGTIQGTESQLWIPGEIEPPEIIAASGYRVAGWDSTWDAVTTNITVTAQYIKTWNVVFVPGTYGTITSGNRKQTVDEGNDAIPPVIEEKPNWRLVGWDKAYTNITSGRIIRAQYVATRNVTFDLGENGELVIGETNQIVDVGGNAIPPDIEAKKGYRFTGWDTSFENITEHTTVTAQYVKTWNVVFVPGTYGTIVSGDRKQTVDEGCDAIPPVIEPKANWRLVGWENSYTNITSGRIIRAVYRQTVSVRFDCGENASLPDSQNLEEGIGTYDVGYAFGTLPAASHPDYRFAGWETQSGALVTESTLANTGDTVLRAIWVQRGADGSADPIPAADLIPVSQIADRRTADTPVAVPFAWLREKVAVASSIVADTASAAPRYYLRQDFEQAAMSQTGKRDFAGRQLRVWQDYLAGTDPNNPADQFTITALTTDGNGLRIRWYPDLGADRRYVIYGKRTLSDPEWTTPTNSTHRFFQIEVKLP